MKLSIILLITSTTLISASVYSQNTKLTLNLSDIGFEELFQKIEDQSEYNFAFIGSILDSKQKISIKITNGTLEEILDEVLPKDVSYEIIDTYVVIKHGLGPVTLPSTQQLKTVSGVVVDDLGKPLPGVTIVVKGTSNGAITNNKGAYTIYNVEENAVLRFSYIGMHTLEVEVGERSEINVSLKEDIAELNEVVVVGYGTMKKSDLTGSLSSVRGEDLSAYPSTNVLTALQGKATGVHVQQNNGQPGSSIQVRIRGANSVLGNNEPLWLINGYPGDPSILNTSDIKSIEILKDASATAIYGSRGANGVIIITTKQPEEGDIKVDFNTSFGLQSIANKLDLLDAPEYMNYINEKSDIRGGVLVFTDEDISSFEGTGTDWQDEIFRTAMVSDNSLNITGGTGKIKANMGASYLNQEGIVLNSCYNRFTLRSGIQYDLSDKIKFSGNIILARLGQNKMDSQGGSRGTSVISSALIAPPTANPRNDDGSWSDFQDQPIAPMNAMAYLNEITRYWSSNRIMANGALIINPIDGLSINLSGNVNSYANRQNFYQSLDFPNSSGAASIVYGETTHISSSNTVTYEKQIKEKHSFKIMGGLTYDSNEYTSTGSGTATGFLSDATNVYDIESAENSGLPYSSFSDWTLLSYIGRLNYAYDNRYLMTVNFRADGSSRYSAGNKWGYFPSFSLAWRLSQEEFLKNVSWLSNLKIRAGYGNTGSTAISPYTTLNVLNSEYTVFNKDVYVAYAPSDSYQGNLKWENTEQTDVGVDLALFNSRLRITSDYYYKRTTDLLSEVEMPRSSGYTVALKNIGSIQNQGFEFLVDARIIDKSLKWDFGVNYSLNRSKVLSLSGGEDIYGSTLNNTILNDQLNLIRVGEPMCVFYGYVEDGYDEYGNIVYKDFDNDGAITSEDKIIIGDPNPDFLFNANTSVRFRNWELNAFIQGSVGNDIYSLSMAAEAYDFLYNGNTLVDVVNDHWTEINQDAFYPSYTQSSYMMSDRFVYDGSYVRLRNLELVYLLPMQNSLWLRKGEIFVSTQNLFTITNYPFWDPDVNAKGGGNSIVQGVDSYNYPSAKTYTIGVRLKF